MNRYIKGVTALSVLAVLLLVGTFLFNPLGESVDAKQDSKVSNKSPLPNALVPVVAESLGRDNPSYHINSTKDLHTANTPRHGLETSFEKSSVTFKSGSDSFELSLDALGRGDQLNPVSTVSEAKVINNRLEYTRGDVTEWYLNSALGMEQGFTLSQRPDGVEDKVSVVLGLSTNGDLTPKETKNGKSIIFTDSTGEVAMSYSKLYVYDANHKELESSMKLSDKGIVIAFNDTGATYPVVVDPFVEVQRILASDGNDDDFFGTCSAVYDNFAVVGAPEKGRGYAYIFERDMSGTWTEVESIRGQDNGVTQSNADFGYSCDISATSDFGVDVTAFAVIGARFDDRSSGNDPGAAYIYERNAAGTWTFVRQIEPSNPWSESFMRFGTDVAITSEGYIIVGAPFENWDGLGGCDSDRGAAYYYERNGSWPNTQTQRVTASDSTCFDYFGDAVGIDSSFSIIGAPFWDATGNDDEGAVYMFELNGSWSQNGGAINPSEVDDDDHFGNSVDIYAGDGGERAIAGAPDANFSGPGSDSDRGEAYILVRVEGSAPNWDSDITRIRSEFPQGGAHFGSCVGIWDEYAISGSRDQSFSSGSGFTDKGIATIYTQDDGSWPVEQTIIASDRNSFDRFGSSCDIDGLGTDLLMMDRGVETDSGPYVIYEPVVIVGAPGNNIDGDTDQGAAYLFEEEQPNGTITIAKATIPAGFVADFDFEGSENLPDGNPCEAFSLSDGQEQECGDLPADTYTFFETETNDSTVQVSCLGGTWTPLENGVQIDLAPGNDITCTFANTLPLELTPLFPSIRNLVNMMTASQATPGGAVAFVWGFQLGSTIVGGPTCNGVELGINPVFQFLGTEAADGSGAAEMIFFVPSLAGVNPVYAQAIDVATCRMSEVVESILTNQ